MHFFYLDESGCSGSNLAANSQQEPIFVLGGISVRDEGWRKTHSEFHSLVSSFFGGQPPPNFELHAHELLSPDGTGPFAERARADRNDFALSVLDLIARRGHNVHFVALDKIKMLNCAVGNEHEKFDARVPYLLAYNYLVSYVERFCREKLGKSARGMIIVDPKDQFNADVERIIHFRRYETPKSVALKWIVEFSYAIDSKRHPMIQMSDLVIFLVRKFLEVDSGYRPSWSQEAKDFYALAYDKVLQRLAWKDAIPHLGRPEKKCHELINEVRSSHRLRWRQYYSI